MQIEWRDEWLVGEDRIDGDHRELQSIINRIYQAVEQRESRAAVTQLLRALLARSAEHFSYEECLMAGSGYPKAESHRSQHAMLINIGNILTQNIDLTNNEIVLGTIGFFGDWLITDIENNDAAFGRFLAARH
ncbi:MAG: hemerythrin family protein [Rhodospirillaceae bacterium]